MYSHMVKPDLPWRGAKSAEVLLFGIFSFEIVGEPTGEEVANTNELFRETVVSLLSLLPEASRRLVGKMLAPDPLMRAGWAEIWADEWVRGISCPMDKNKSDAHA